MRPLLSPASSRSPREQKSRRSHTLLKAPPTLSSLPLQKAKCDMNDGEQHDGEGEVRDKDRRSSTSSADRAEPELVAVEGSGLSGPFIRRPVLTLFVTVPVIVVV